MTYISDGLCVDSSYTEMPHHLQSSVTRCHMERSFPKLQQKYTTKPVKKSPKAEIKKKNKKKLHFPLMSQKRPWC